MHDGQSSCTAIRKQADISHACSYIYVWVYAGFPEVDFATCHRCNTVPEAGRVEDGMLST
jgi:hypothetical protein